MDERHKKFILEFFRKGLIDLGVNQLVVDLVLFKSKESMAAFEVVESRKVGVAVSEIEGFVATHEAWFGTPRVLVNVGDLVRLPKTVREAVLLHEAAHVILHGSLRSYLFSLPDSLVKVGERFGLRTDYLFNVLYLIALSVKDYEVTKLLVEKGYRDHCAAYFEYFLASQASEYEKLNGLSALPELMVIRTLSIMKTLAGGAAMIGDREIMKTINEVIRKLPKAVREGFTTIIREISSLDYNTDRNVLKISELVANLIIIPVLERDGDLRRKDV